MIAMSKKLSIVIVVLILLVFVGAAIYTNHKAKTIDYSSERQQAIEEAESRPDVTINTKHQYKNGQHIYVGTVEIPGGCYSAGVEVKKSADITEIALNYKDVSVPSQKCDDEVQERKFKVAFEGSEDEEIIATLNGEAVNLNIFEVDPDENIDETDIFIKG